MNNNNNITALAETTSAAKFETKKFWCHYIGSDGNTPRRRNKELIKLTIQGVTLWAEFEPGTYNEGYYHLYCQLADKVAVTCNKFFMASDLEDMRKSDDQFQEELDAKRKDPNNSWKSDYIKTCIYNLIRYRFSNIDLFKKLANFADYLLKESSWVTLAQLAAYKEVNHPLYPSLLEKRKACEAIRAQREAERKEEEQKRKEEEERQAREEAEKELARLNKEEVKFKNGEYIAGEDVVTLCKRHGISIHLRTIHNLQQVIFDINGTGYCRYYTNRGKRKPVLDGCYTAAELLYKKLHEEAETLTAPAEKCAV